MNDGPGRQGRVEADLCCPYYGGIGVLDETAVTPVNEVPRPEEACRVVRKAA
jgi:hypothetical protein